MTKIAIRLAETHRKLTAVRKERRALEHAAGVWEVARTSDWEEILEKTCRELQTLRHLECLLEDCPKVELEGFAAPLKAYCEKL